MGKLRIHKRLPSRWPMGERRRRQRRLDRRYTRWLDYKDLLAVGPTIRTGVNDAD